MYSGPAHPAARRRKCHPTDERRVADRVFDRHHPTEHFPAAREITPRSSTAPPPASADVLGERHIDLLRIRAIAKDAWIDPSMVMRYYGNRESLFAAAVSHDLRLPDLGAVPRCEAGHALVSHFLTLAEENEKLTAMLRVAVTNARGAEQMQAIFGDQVLPVARRVCPDPEQAPARAASPSPNCSAWP